MLTWIYACAILDTYIFFYHSLVVDKMNELEINKSAFEDIKHIDENGKEYWEARELMIALEYKKWDKFKNVISNAMMACINSNNKVDNHFSQLGKMVEK